MDFLKALKLLFPKREFQMCLNCRGQGFFMAWAKEAPIAAATIFTCSCRSAVGPEGPIQRRKWPQWNAQYERLYVAEWRDEPLTKYWLHQQFRDGLTKTPEFKRRVDIWGRDWIRDEYKRWKEDQASLHPADRVDGIHSEPSVLLDQEEARQTEPHRDPGLHAVFDPAF